MAGKAEVKVVISGDAKSAQNAVRETETALGKLGTLSSKASDEIGKAFGGTKLGAITSKAQSLFGGVGKSASSTGLLIGAGIGGGIAAAGVAFGKFALDGVGAFQKTALAAGKFSDATGLSVQQSSKYLEVSHDLGISADTFQSAFVKMEKSLDTNRAAFGDLVATTSSGAVDLNQTFLNVITHIQGIKDPLQRANESAKLFGRGFADVAEVINTSADDITTRLGQVRDEQIINPKELDQARSYRDAMNELGDSFEALQIAAGQRLVPALAGLAQKGADLLDIFNQLTTKDYGSTVSQQSDVITEATKAQQTYNQEINAYKNSVGEGAGVARRFIDIQNNYTGSTKAATDALKAEQDALNNLSKAADDLLGSTTNVDRAQQDFIDKMKALQVAQLDAAKGGKDHADKLRSLRIAIDDAKDSAQALGQANVKQAETQAASIGKTLTAAQENKILADTYRALAGTAKGPVADALRGTALLLDAVGKKKPNPTVNANVKPAKVNINDVQRLADNYDKTRAIATLEADKKPAQDSLTLLKNALAAYDRLHPEAEIDADTAPAHRKMSAITSTLAAYDRAHPTASVDVNDHASGPLQHALDLLRTFGRTHATATIGTVNPKVKGAGGPVSAGQPYIVGDKGPELLIPRTAGTIIPNSALMSGRSGGWTGGGPTYNITVNGAVDPVATAKQIKAILAKGERAGVR